MQALQLIRLHIDELQLAAYCPMTSQLQIDCLISISKAEQHKANLAAID